MRNNDIVFFNLHRRYLNMNTNYTVSNGIYNLSAFLNANGYRAQGFSGELCEGKNLLDKICSTHKTAAIGLYCDYENVTENIFLSKYVKETYGLPVFVGGPQATALDEKFINSAKCDVIVRYEGELTVLELLHYFIDGTGSLDKIKGIMYMDRDVLCQNHERELIENLNILPFVNDECRLIQNSNSKNLNIMTGRGCPFHCAFCHEGHHTKKVRLRSVENVLAEIEIFLDNREENDSLYIYFTDDTFTLDAERVKTLCSGLQELRKKKDFRWFCEGHIHMLYLHPEMLTYMVNAGMKRLQLGIESGTQSVLNAYRKGSTVEEIEYVVKKCVEAGVEQIYANIILGGAHFNGKVFENEKIFVENLLNLAPGRMEIGVVSYWPLPNTSISNNPKDYGLRIVDKDFITAVGDFPQVETSELNRYDIIDMMQELENHIAEIMKNIICSGVLKTEQILSWFPENNTCRYNGLWFYHLQNIPNVYNYHMLLKLKEAYSEKQIKYINYYNLHPMRTVSLYKNWKVQSDGTVKFFDCFLDGFEQDVLIYATGKLSVKEISERLIINGYSADGLLEKCAECLRKLEKNYLVAYSKY